jgi:hypothetical protein
MKYLSNFKKIVLIAVKNKWLPSDPFANFKFTKKLVLRLALTEHELNAIATKNFKNERLRSVRDIFIYSCYTGLSYADVQKLRADEINIGINKKLWIFTNRQKTGTATRSPLMLGREFESLRGQATGAFKTRIVTISLHRPNVWLRNGVMYIIAQVFPPAN